MNKDLQNLEVKVENEGTTPQGRLTATEWNILVAAVKSLDLTGGSADATSILQVVADAGYATQEWVTSQKYITSLALDNLAKNLVTLDTTQAITGMKDFTNGLKIGGVSVYKSKEGIVFVDGNLAVRGAITMYADNGQAAPSIFDALPIDNETIKRNANGELYAVGGGGSGTGGLDYETLDDYLTTNGYATQSWVTGKGYITSDALEPYALKTAIPTSLKNPNALSWNGYSSGSYDGSTAQSITIPNNTNQLTNGAGFITGISSSMVTNALGYTPLSTSGGTVNGAVSIEGVYYSTGTVTVGSKVGLSLGDKWFGTSIWSEGSGRGYIQQQRFDNTTTTYDLCLQPFGGNVAIGGTTASDKLYVYGAISSENANADAGFRAKGSAYALFFGIGSGNVNRGIYDDYYKAWWMMRGADKTTTIDGSMVASGLRINQTTFNNGLTLNRTSANAGAGIVFQSNGSLLGQIGINGTKTFEVSDGTTIKASIEIPTGNLLTTGAITMYYSSDKRLKQNIRKGNASEVLMSLGGVFQYEYIDSEVAKNSTYGGSHFGLIYQNVKGTALDKMCFEREDGYGALNYLDTNFISLIAGATIEVISEIEQIKRENRELRKELEQLKQRVA